MSFVHPLLLWTAAWVGSAPVDELSGSFLFVPPAGAEDSEQVEAATYVPQAGDLVLFRNGSFFYRAAFHLTVTGPPTHIAIVVELPDKTFATLESVDHRTGVRLMALPGRLQTYDGKVWVRRIKKPLTPEQRAELMNFAVEQEGKSFAQHRVLLPALVPLLRCRIFARLYPDKDYHSRHTWFCSELVAAACVRIRLFPATRIRPWCTFPVDFFDDGLLDLSQEWEPARTWGETPELRDD